MPTPFYGIENSSAYPSLPKANLANERSSFDFYFTKHFGLCEGCYAPVAYGQYLPNDRPHIPLVCYGIVDCDYHESYNKNLPVL